MHKVHYKYGVNIKVRAQSIHKGILDQEKGFGNTSNHYEQQHVPLLELIKLISKASKLLYW